MKATACVFVGLWMIAILPAAASGQEAAVPQEEGMFPAEEVTFRTRGYVLSGTLYKPRSEGPHPAIVLLAGSGPADRTSGGYFPFIQPVFLEAGLAVLVYDKPGVGGSTGDWRTMTLRDRAEEAVSAVRFLRDRADIRSDAVGLWGGSQGGWVAPLATTLYEDIAFVISVSGPGLTPAEQNVFEVEMALRNGGHQSTVVRQGIEWAEGLMQAALNGRAFSEVEREYLAPAEGRPWAGIFSIPDQQAWDFLASVDPVTGTPNGAFDPVPVLRAMAVPYLAIFGEEDDLVPVARSVSIKEAALQEAPIDDFRIVVFPEANHGILVGPRIFAPGYLELMGDWVRERVGSR